MRINESLARRLITAQFPEWQDYVIRPVRYMGWDNKTFHLGEHMLMRLPSAECYAAKVVIEQQWLPKLAPHLPLPIPMPLARGEAGEGYPWEWSIYRWLGRCLIKKVAMFFGQPYNWIQTPGHVVVAGHCGRL